jgi:hypothetical protein
MCSSGHDSADLENLRGREWRRDHRRSRRTRPKRSRPEQACPQIGDGRPRNNAIRNAPGTARIIHTVEIDMMLPRKVNNAGVDLAGLPSELAEITSVREVCVVHREDGLHDVAAAGGEVGEQGRALVERHDVGDHVLAYRRAFGSQ